MKIRSLIVSSFAALLLCVPVVARAQTGEEIRSFAVDLTVDANGTLNVVERIDYVFPEQRHGIYRDIPTKYRNDEGEYYRIPISVMSVRSAEGSAWRFQVETNDVGIRIKIGDPNLTISGPQTYVITYRADGALRYFGDHDELFWNATGTEWTVPIRRATAVVNLPDNVPAAEIRRRCFTGPKGSTSEECLIGGIGNSSHFAADGPLTVVVGWPPGLVAKIEAEPVPTAPTFVLYVIPFLVGAFLFAAWWSFGRDTGGRKTIMVQYDPPNGITPGELGVLMDQRADLHDITSTIVDLAVRGWLKIKETTNKGLIFSSKDFEFELLKGITDQELKPHEKKVLSAFFGGASIITLSSVKTGHSFYASIPDIKSKLYGQLVAMGYFPRNPETVKLIYGLVSAAILLAVYAALAIIYSVYEFAGDGNLWMIMFLTLIICGIFVSAMAKRTPAGALAHEHGLGFKDYLATAEKYRIQWQEKENIFEKFLPYAMVLGVADKWGKTFADLGLPPPTWYEGSAVSSGTFNALAFTSAMGSLDSSMGAAMTSAPSQSSSGSGFGGGGSSGGGGGGGGGGSW